MTPLRSHWLLARQLIKRVNVQKYYKHICVMASLVAICSTLMAVSHHADGSWQWPLIYYYIGVTSFTLASVEIIIVLFDEYKNRIRRHKVFNRAIYYYGLAISMISMSDFYIQQTL